MVLVGKIAAAQNIDWPTTAGLLLTLLSYNAKKVLAAKDKAAEQSEVSKLAEIEKKLLDLTNAFNFKSLR
jgi:hypothetical protein